MDRKVLSARELAMMAGSSIGSQPKYYKDGYWYKVNQIGSEGRSEHLTSIVLKHSNVSNFVVYEECMFNGKKGCRSKNFLKDNEVFMSFQRLYEMNVGGELSDRVRTINDVKERIDFVLDFVYEVTKLDYSDYLSKVLSLDALLLNTDRHFHNLGIVIDTKKDIFKEAPIFDNGNALLSDLSRFPIYDSIEENVNKVYGQPFSANLFMQAKEAGFGLKINYDTLKADLKNEEKSRNLDVLLSQLDLYEKILCEKKNVKVKKEGRKL